MKDRPTLSVVIPVYNERPTIEELLIRVQAVDIDKEIIVVDDGSTDGTREFLEELAQNTKPVMTLPQTQCELRTDNMRIEFQEKNRGKGASLRRGFQAAHGEIVIVR